MILMTALGKWCIGFNYAPKPEGFIDQREVTGNLAQGTALGLWVVIKRIIYCFQCLEFGFLLSLVFEIDN